MFGSPFERDDWNAAIIAASVHNAGFATKTAKGPKDFLLTFETEQPEANVNQIIEAFRKR